VNKQTQIQARVHQFRPWPNAAEKGPAAAAEQEQKEEPRVSGGGKE